METEHDQSPPGDDGYVNEVWTFLGSRVNAKDVRVHAWTVSDDTDSRELWYKAKGRYAVGGNYRVLIKRVDKSTYMRGVPEYVGPHPDTDRQAEIAARHRAAEITLTQLALERSQSRRDPIDEAMAPLVELAKRVPASQRDAFSLYVMRQFMRVW